MCLREGRNRLFGSYHWQWHRKNGSFKAKGSSGLAEAKNAYRNKAIPWIHRLLSILYSQILQNRMTTLGSYKERSHVEMGRMATMGIQRAKDTYVLWTSITTTRLWKEVLPPSRCVIIRRGRRTLAGGKTPYANTSQTTQTHFTSHSILFSHVHPN